MVWDWQMDAPTRLSLTFTANTNKTNPGLFVLAATLTPLQGHCTYSAVLAGTADSGHPLSFPLMKLCT